MSGKYILGMVLSVVVVVGGLMLWGFYKNAQDMEGPGRPWGAALAREGELATLVLFDQIDHNRSGKHSYDSRLFAVDAHTGKRLALRSLEPNATLCATDASGKLWCDIDSKMRGVNARTLADESHAGTAPDKPSYMVPPHCKPAAVGSDRLELESDAIVRTGKTPWKLPLEGSCQLLEVVGDLVVVAIDNSRTRAIAVDATTGAVRWRVTF